MAKKINKRQFLIGTGATIITAATPQKADAFLFGLIARFAFASFARRTIAQTITRSAISRSARKGLIRQGYRAKRNMHRKGYDNAKIIKAGISRFNDFSDGVALLQAKDNDGFQAGNIITPRQNINIPPTDALALDTIARKLPRINPRFRKRRRANPWMLTKYCVPTKCNHNYWMNGTYDEYHNHENPSIYHTSGGTIAFAVDGLQRQKPYLTVSIWNGNSRDPFICDKTINI